VLQALLAFADWLGNHGLTVAAGFVGGVVGSEVRARWIARRLKKRGP
jgi:succinate-acetate transporter protein